MLTTLPLLIAAVWRWAATEQRIALRAEALRRSSRADDGGAVEVGQHGEHPAVVVAVGCRPSLVKMLVACLSTAFSVITMRSAIAWLVRPSAINPRTSDSRGVEPGQRVERRRQHHRSL